MTDLLGKKRDIINYDDTLSLSNSSATPLGINGVFTGSWEDTFGYAELAITVFTDKSSITDGLDIQWSNDKVSIMAHDNFTISASSGKQFTFPCNPRYFRVVYTNDGVAQTYFNLACVLKRFSSKGSSHRLKDTLSQDDDAIVTKTLIAGLSSSGGGTIVNVKVNPSGALQIASTSTSYTTRIDKVTTSGIVYIGKANPGSLTSSAVWQVMKIDKTGVTENPVITWADGGNFTQIWDDRTSLTYS